MSHRNWWIYEGSGMRPHEGEDIEEFAMRITQIAWSNGEYLEREACAKTCENLFQTTRPYEIYAEAAQECADEIRARNVK